MTLEDLHEYNKKLIQQYGVKFCPHSQSKKSWMLDKCAAMLGVKNWKRFFIFTMDPVVYHPDGVNMCSPDQTTGLAHELLHLRRQRVVGLKKWLLKYVFSQRFRCAEEIEAYRGNVEFGADPVNILNILRENYFISCFKDSEILEKLSQKNV